MLKHTGHSRISEIVFSLDMKSPFGGDRAACASDAGLADIVAAATAAGAGSISSNAAHASKRSFVRVSTKVVVCRSRAFKFASLRRIRGRVLMSSKDKLKANLQRRLQEKRAGMKAKRDSRSHVTSSTDTRSVCSSNR